jgi:DNA-binding beta-propeller fold protein YncE
MKRSLVLVTAVAAVFLSAATLWGEGEFYVVASKGKPGPPGASLNPLQIATLRWYEASLNGQFFAVGTFPLNISCDGGNIWVANYNSNNVTKLRASDGEVLGTYAVGLKPSGIAFDGANIWVANSASNNVCKR